jgi:hypothetical protein
MRGPPRRAGESLSLTSLTRHEHRHGPFLFGALVPDGAGVMTRVQGEPPRARDRHRKAETRRGSGSLPLKRERQASRARFRRNAPA